MAGWIYCTIMRALCLLPVYTSRRQQRLVHQTQPRRSPGAWGPRPLRTRIHNHSTPSERVFCRPAALKNLAIHKVLSAFFRLAGQQNPSPIRHPLIMDTGSNKRHRVYTCALLAMITMIVYVFSVCWWYLSIISSILIFCRLFCKSSRTF